MRLLSLAIALAGLALAAPSASAGVYGPPPGKVFHSGTGGCG